MSRWPPKFTNGTGAEAGVVAFGISGLDLATHLSEEKWMRGSVFGVIMDHQYGGQTIEYGVVPLAVMASMSGLDFVRAIFARRLPEPPIMHTVEPFDCTAEPGLVVIHSVPGLRHYNPIGSVHGGYSAILLDSAMGLAVQSTLPAGTGYTTLEFKISFVRGMSETSGVVRTEGRVLNAGRRVASAEARITDPKGRLLAHATTTCLVFEIPKEISKDRR
jgi:uncharacterized protein (TIGR00369 family)